MRKTIVLKKDKIGYYLEISKAFLEDFQKEQKNFEHFFKKYTARKENDWFFIAPRNYMKIKDLITNSIEETNNLLNNQINSNNKIIWAEENLVNKLLGKALITFTIEPTEDLSFKISNEIKKQNKNRIHLFEFGTGAGIATSLVYKNIKRLNPNKNINIISVDINYTSIITSAILFSIFKIPYRIVNSYKDLERSQSFEGIILILSDGTHLFDKKFNKIKFDYFFSDHGIVYLSNLESSHLLNNIAPYLRSGGLILLTGLYPNVFEAIGLKKKLLSVIMGNNLEKVTKRLNLNQNCFKWEISPEKDKRFLKEIYSVGVAKAYDLLHDLLCHSLINFIIYLRLLIKLSKDLPELSAHVHSPIKIYKEDKETIKTQDIYSSLSSNPRFKKITVFKYPKCIRNRENEIPFIQMLIAHYK